MGKLYLISVLFFVVLPSIVFSEEAGDKKNEIDPGLFITANEVKKKNKSKDRPVLVDVRSKAKFALFKIPGSLNLPLYAIKTKEILKTEFIVLLNEGFHNSPLIRECNSLREKGFNASILYGGLNAWKRGNGRIDGDYFELKKINQMPPLVLFGEKKFANWVIVDVSENQSPYVKKRLPESIHVPYSPDPALFIKKITGIVKKNKGEQLFSLLVFNTNGDGYEKIEATLSCYENLIFLKGGANGYLKFLEKQALIWNRDKSKKVSTRKCSSCS